MVCWLLMHLVMSLRLLLNLNLKFKNKIQSVVLNIAFDGKRKSTLLALLSSINQWSLFLENNENSFKARFEQEGVKNDDHYLIR